MRQLAEVGRAALEGVSSLRRQSRRQGTEVAQRVVGVAHQRVQLQPPVLCQTGYTGILEKLRGA